MKSNKKYKNILNDSIFNKLRLITFRNKLKDFKNVDLDNYQQVIEIIDSTNKDYNLNLIVLNMKGEIQNLYFPNHLQHLLLYLSF